MQDPFQGCTAPDQHGPSGVRYPPLELPMLAHRTWRPALAAAALLTLSLAAFASTLVGNPKFLPGLLNVPSNVSMPVADIVLDDCQGGGTTLDVDMDLTDPFAVALPSGTWCAISVVFESAIEVE